jgi:cobalt-zinc-cadmium efflux system protein
VNGVAAAILFRGSGENLNLRASFLHLASDAVASVLVIVAGVVIVATGFELADPIASLVLAALVAWSGLGVLRASTAILMEQAPSHLPADEIARAILGVPGVESLHDLHVWTIGAGFDALSAHVLVGRGEDCHGLRREVEEVLHERFGIEHTTLQVDHAAASLLQIERPA